MAHPGAPAAVPGVRLLATPEKFDGSPSADWTAWQLHFEQVAQANNWTPAEQTTFVPLYLTGAAQLFYQSLAQATRAGAIAGLLQALANRFAPAANVDLHRAELQARYQGPDESLSNYCEAIRRLSRLAYPTLPGNVQDVLAKDRFLAGLHSKEIRLEVRRAAPATLNDALTHSLQAFAIFATERTATSDAAPDGLVCAASAAPSADLSGVLSHILERLGQLEAAVSNQQQGAPRQQPPSMPAFQPRCYGRLTARNTSASLPT